MTFEQAQPGAVFRAAIARDAMGRVRLGDVLITAGVITSAELADVLARQGTGTGTRQRLGVMLVEMGFAREDEIAEALAAQLGLPMLDLGRRLPSPEVIRLLPRAVAERAQALVVEFSENGLVIAMADPTNVLALDDIKLHTRAKSLTVLVSTPTQIADQVARAWSLNEDVSGVAAIVETMGSEARDAADPTDTSTNDGPIVQLVNRILSEAVRARASDVHVETQRDSLRVRYRVDGLLREAMTTSRRVAPAVISRLKIVSGLDIAERRVPQDGRARITVDGEAVDCRVSTVPGVHGEKVVIRLLSRGAEVSGLDALGFSPSQLALFRSVLTAPQGLVLITGPTGSGKTNTLYSAIAEIVSPDKNVVTLEDPVEVQLPGITQVQVHERAGMTFEKGLRAVLRQDPDVVLVGEVRDPQTAELALKAALTGHLVLTTLHTNSAVAALTRLVDMGIEPFLVASSLTLSVAQRLVRVPCDGCAVPYMPDDDVLMLLGLTHADLKDATPRKGAGCVLCAQSGYVGRTGVYEVLEVDAAMRRILVKDPTESAVGAQARATRTATLRTSALEKARRGDTTFEEVVRVTHSDYSAARHCPTCERSVEHDMVACPWCATALDGDQCSGCRRHREHDWTVCPWCRTAAPSASVQKLGDGAAKERGAATG